MAMLKSEQVTAKVRDIVIAQLGLDEEDLKNEDDLFERRGMDSLAIVETVLALEEEFEMDVPDQDMEKNFITVDAAVTYLMKRVGSFPER